MHHTTLVLLASLISLACCDLSWAETTDAATVAAAIGEKPERAKPKYPTIYVEDMHCKHCAKRLARKLFTIPGVKKVRANVTKNYAVVEPQKEKQLSPLQLWEAAEAAKFKVERIETPTDTYEKKPEEEKPSEKVAKSSP